MIREILRVLCLSHVSGDMWNPANQNLDTLSTVLWLNTLWFKSRCMCVSLQTEEKTFYWLLLCVIFCHLSLSVFQACITSFWVLTSSSLGAALWSSAFWMWLSLIHIHTVKSCWVHRKLVHVKAVFLWNIQKCLTMSLWCSKVRLSPFNVLQIHDIFRFRSPTRVPDLRFHGF